MDYFYCPPGNITATSVRIDGEEFVHLARVMRKKEGDDICVVDGNGKAYDVRLESIQKTTATGTIRHTHEQFHEQALHVSLAVGILKNPSKFDFLIEKVTELGVREIIPLRTERTIPDYAKVDRWQKLALAGMKQCGRSYLPRVRELLSLRELFAKREPSDVTLIAHERSSDLPRFDQLVSKNIRSLLILVGPEGGFSDDEVTFCVSAGCQLFTLGDRRLRTETAAIVTAALSFQHS
jgi:16S rRNA (uracil1498-N3)-methyltransferase